MKGKIALVTGASSGIGLETARGLAALGATVVLLALWMAFTRTGRQAWSVTNVGIATIPQRLGSSSVIIVGIAGVVGVLVALLAMAEGFRQTLAQTGDAETAIVMRGGATAELSSGIAREDATLIEQLPGILKDAAGKPIASPELVVVANIPKKASATDANVEIRGVGFFERRAVRSEMLSVPPPWYTPWRRWLDPVLFDVDVFRADLDRVRANLREAGHYEAEVTYDLAVEQE